jgi:hypothetical protein
MIAGWPGRRTAHGYENSERGYPLFTTKNRGPKQQVRATLATARASFPRLLHAPYHPPVTLQDSSAAVRDARAL